MSVITLGAAPGEVYRPDYQLRIFRQGHPGRPLTGVDLRSGLSINTSKSIQDISGTFTIALKDNRAWREIQAMDVIRIRLRGHDSQFPTVMVGVVDEARPGMSIGTKSAEKTTVITGRCTGKYLQVTSLFRPVWDPSTNIPTALTFGLGGPTNQPKTPRGIFGYLLRAFTYGRRNMVGESGIPNSRFWLHYKERFERINYQIPFLQFDESDMGTVLKTFEILGFTEAWVDELGYVVYRKPQWDQPASFYLPVSRIKGNPQLADGDVDLKTYVEVIPAANPGISSSLAQALLAGRAPVPSSYLHAASSANNPAPAASREFIIDTSGTGKVTATGLRNVWYRRQLKFGVRPLQITSSLLASQEQAQAQAEGLLRFFSRQVKTATITIPGDPRVRLGTSVRLRGTFNDSPLDRTYYIEGVSHDYVEGDHYDTILTLTHGKDPWDPHWGQIALPSASLGKIVSEGGVSAPGATPGSSSAGGVPNVTAGGGWTFPLPIDAASAPTTWTQDQGVDIAAAGGTPLIAMRSGKVVRNGISGFGPNAPVLDIGGGLHIYYGHAGPSSSPGTTVNAGDQVGIVGYGVVGISTGPHLEIGFCDKDGTPLPNTSDRMLSILRTAYGS